MAERLYIPPGSGGNTAAWERKVASAFNSFVDQTAFNGAIYVWDKGCLAVPTNTTESGAAEINFESPFSGNGTVLVTVVGAEGGVTASLNGTNLGTMSNVDTSSEIRYEFYVDNLVEGDNPLNSFKIWSTTADEAEVRRVEIWRNHVKDAIDAASTVETNFNARNDRDGSAITNPTIAVDGTAIDHTINTDGSADISFEWAWSGAEADIDGFIIHTRNSSSATSYNFGTTPAEETLFFVPAEKRAVFLFGVPVDRYYTFGVQAYRVVDPDIDASGHILSLIVQPALGAEDPYQPDSNVAFAGNVTGTIDGTAAGDVNKYSKLVDDAGTQPEDNATVGAPLGTNVGSIPAELLASLGKVVFFDDFSEYSSVAEWEANVQFQQSSGERSFVTGESGKQALQCGNSSGVDEVWPIYDQHFIPVQAGKLYLVQARVRILTGTAAAAALYVGFNGWAADKATKVNTLGADNFSSQHYAAAQALVHTTDIPLDTWTTVTGYLKDFSGTPSSSNKNDPGAPGQFHTDVKFVTPLFIFNYNDEAGTMQIQWIKIQELEGALAVADFVSLADNVRRADGLTLINEADFLATWNKLTAGNAATYLNSQSIGTVQLADTAITTAKLATGAVDNSKLAALAVDAAKLATDAVTNAKVADGAIDTSELAALAVTEAKIGSAAVTSAKIGALAVGTAAIANLAVGTAQIADTAITEAKIGTAAVTNAKIGSAAVTSAKIGSAAVLTAAIADAQISSAKIIDGAVTNAKIGSAAITNAKIDNLAVTNAKIDNLTIATGKVANNAITKYAFDENGSGITESAGTETDMGNISFTKDEGTGSDIVLRGYVEIRSDDTSAATGILRLRRDGNLLKSWLISSTGSGDRRHVVGVYQDAGLSSGSYTFKWTVARLTNGVVVDIGKGILEVLEVKK